MDSSSSTIHPNIRYDFKPTNNQRQPLRLHRQDHGARSSVIRRRVPSVGRSLIGGKPPASLFWGAFARFRPVVAGAIFRARNRDRKEKVVRRRGQNPDWKWSGIRAPGFFFFFFTMRIFKWKKHIIPRRVPRPGNGNSVSFSCRVVLLHTCPQLNR